MGETGLSGKLGGGIVIFATHGEDAAGCVRLVFLSGSSLGLIKVGFNQGVGERLTNHLLLLSDKVVPVE